MCLFLFVCAGLQPAHPTALGLLRLLSAAWNTKKMDPKSQSNSYSESDWLNSMSWKVSSLRLKLLRSIHVQITWPVCCYLCFQGYSPVMVGTPRAQNQGARGVAAASSTSHNPSTEVILNFSCDHLCVTDWNIQKCLCSLLAGYIQWRRQKKFLLGARGFRLSPLLWGLCSVPD